ncbi:FAD-dependent oxidoreductase [Desulfosporosinus sp.]|uniref:NAD(P)/FAD-dependent oxidoreductase n=1 Tax=Desulfosporosinus sp. TaxID=157907 RepID=UPI0025C2DC1C|nr:FAD-dependent oxidoreductase [Desulfosporosinus sp.]
MPQQIAIIGNGIAALSAIKSIREVDKQSEIHLIGEEKFYPYNRIRLSKGLLSSLEADKILLQNKEWYRDNEINLYLGTGAVSIDTREKSVQLSDGKVIGYDKLLIANGSHNIEPSVPGIKTSGVYTLKTLLDDWNIMDYIKGVEKILIIGGGIQGLETAWILSEMGKKVILSNRSQRLMRKELDEEASDILAKAIESSGIEILFNTEIAEISGRDKVEGFKTVGGEVIDCDAVIYSIGTKPNIDIIGNTKIDTNYGILVDERMETNLQDIYAAGDVAEYKRKPYGLWNIAIGQGKVAGYNISGKNAIFDHIVPVTTLNAFKLSLFSMGEVKEDKATNIVVDRLQENNYRKILFNNDRIIGAMVIGDIKSSPALKVPLKMKFYLRT